MTCHALFSNLNDYRSPSLEQDVLSLVFSLLLRLTKAAKSLMELKHSVQWRSMLCHITDSRVLIRESMVKDQPFLQSTACSCGILFLQVAFLMCLEVLSRYSVCKNRCCNLSRENLKSTSHVVVIKIHCIKL